MVTTDEKNVTLFCGSNKPCLWAVCPHVLSGLGGVRPAPALRRDINACGTSWEVMFSACTGLLKTCSRGNKEESTGEEALTGALKAGFRGGSNEA